MASPVVPCWSLMAAFSGYALLPLLQVCMLAVLSLQFKVCLTSREPPKCVFKIKTRLCCLWKRRSDWIQGVEERSCLKFITFM